eukprot:5221594-Pleurochrysis_carterae.AAC.1
MEACTMLNREECLNEEKGVGSKGRGEDGEGINGDSGEEECDGSMRTSRWGAGKGPDGRGVAWRHRLRSQAIRVRGRRDGGGGLVGVGLELGTVRETPNDGHGRVE